MLNLEDDLKSEDASASVEKSYMIDAIKEVISNGTVEYKTCKLKQMSSFARESEVNVVVDNIYDLNGIFYQVNIQIR